jgi:hypothetical protein
VVGGAAAAVAVAAVAAAVITTPTTATTTTAAAVAATAAVGFRARDLTQTLQASFVVVVEEGSTEKFGNEMITGRDISRNTTVKHELFLFFAVVAVVAAVGGGAVVRRLVELRSGRRVYPLLFLLFLLFVVGEREGGKEGGEKLGGREGGREGGEDPIKHHHLFVVAEKLVDSSCGCGRRTVVAPGRGHLRHLLLILLLVIFLFPAVVVVRCRV